WLSSARVLRRQNGTSSIAQLPDLFEDRSLPNVRTRRMGLLKSPARTCPPPGHKGIVTQSAAQYVYPTYLCRSRASPLGLAGTGKTGGMQGAVHWTTGHSETPAGSEGLCS